MKVVTHCRTGYDLLWHDVLADGTFSTDINECILEIDSCHVNATCTDIIGHYECTCNSGFEGDGINCTSKDVFQRDHHCQADVYL